MLLFPSSVSRYPYSSTDAHHKVTYGTPQTLSCKYAKKEQVVSDQNGQIFQTVAWLQFPAGTTISKKDKIILPDSTTGVVEIVIPVLYPHNGTAMCVEVYLSEESL